MTLTYPMHDLHVHTKWSDGYHSVAQQVYLAYALCSREQESRLEAVAITDHLLPGSKLAEPHERKAYRGEIADATHRYSDDNEDRSGLPVVLAGVEATAVGMNGFSLDCEVAGEFDWVLCDLSHASTGTLSDTPADKTEYERNVFTTYHAMCDASYIDVIAHPFNTGNTDPSLLPEEYSKKALTELAMHMAATRTVFDVMSSMPWWYFRAGADPRSITANYASLVNLFGEAGVMFQVSSDDHRSGLGSVGWSINVLRQAGVDPSQMVRPGKRLPDVSCTSYTEPNRADRH